MADTTTKRHRDTTVDTQTQTPKRHKTSYINDDQQETTTQELLDFFTSLSPDPVLDFIQPDPDTNNDLTNHDDDKESVIRHLLEASDDELGIPSRVDDSGDVSGCGGDDVSGGDDDVSGGGGGGGNGYGDFWLWELEDEAANYYTLLQSELFMQ